MQLEHEFVVPVPAAQAWPVLLDIERIAPCLPGATVTKVEGRDFEGRVRVKVGPITVTYNGNASFSEVDEDNRRAVIVARGKEARGSGTANATITAQLHDEGDRSRVTVHTDLAITGRPAQFGRGVMNDVGAKLLDRFAACLSEQLAVGEQPQQPAPEVAPAEDAAIPSQPASALPGGAPARQEAGAGSVNGATGATVRPAAAPVRSDEPIDLLETAGGPVLKRLAPVLATLFVLALLVARRRRRRRAAAAGS